MQKFIVFSDSCQPILIPPAKDGSQNGLSPRREKGCILIPPAKDGSQNCSAVAAWKNGILIPPAKDGSQNLRGNALKARKADAFSGERESKPAPA